MGKVVRECGRRTSGATGARHVSAGDAPESVKGEMWAPGMHGRVGASISLSDRPSVAYIEHPGESMGVCWLGS